MADTRDTGPEPAFLRSLAALFANPDGSAVEARAEAQRLAFAPFIFQAARSARDLGVLAAASKAGEAGVALHDLRASTGLADYALRLLVEACVAANLLRSADGRLHLTKTGHFLLNDPLTRVNLDFTHAVCYQGLFHLEETLREGRPAGLQAFGDWPTIYQALAELPAEARRAWFAFDHYYSDAAFPAVLPQVLARHPRRLIDVGGNTGRFAILAARAEPGLSVTICDLPGQLAVAAEAAKTADLADRIATHAVDLLDPAQPLPAGDIVWMSQFLCCFSETEIVTILRRAAAALTPGGRVFILDTFYDHQRFPAAAYCLIASSLYFACLANGNSRMYHSDDLKACIAQAGLAVLRCVDGIGLGHTLLECAPAGTARNGQ